MKSNTHQYYMYGIIVSLEWYNNWKQEKGNTIEAVINEGKTTVDDISCVFSGRDGKFLIIGKILEVFDDDKPIIVKELNEYNKLEIQSSVNKNFGLNGDFNHYFVKSYNNL